MINLANPEARLGLLLTLRRLAASIAVDSCNPDRIASDDAAAITSAAEALSAAVQALRSMPGGPELAVAILNAAEELAARAPLDATRRRVYAGQFKREDQSAKGKRSAVARTKVAKEKWEPHVIALAQAIPGSSYSSDANLAYLVSSHWDLPGRRPGDRKLRGTIADMRKSGRLPKRQPKKKLASNR